MGTFVRGGMATEAYAASQAAAAQSAAIAAAASDATTKSNNAQSAAIAADFGVGQSWQNVTGSRALNVTYYNTTGKPICVSVEITCTLTSTLAATVNGVNVIGCGGCTYMYLSVVVPPGDSYYLYVNQGVPTLGAWLELR